MVVKAMIETMLAPEGAAVRSGGIMGFAEGDGGGRGGATVDRSLAFLA